jgi:pyrophosphatase PpaX
VALRAILLDFDGTFLDSVELILAAYRHTFAVHHGAAPPDEAWLRGIGTPLMTQMKELSRPDDDLDAMYITYRDYVIEHHDRLCAPFEGMPETVRELRVRGMKLAIVTSKRAIGVERGLAPVGMLDAFDTWVCPEHVTHAKPHPEPVWLALEQLGVERDEAVFVGDSPHDLVAGRAAGVATAAVGWGPFDPVLLRSHEPNHWLKTPADLLALLD